MILGAAIIALGSVFGMDLTGVELAGATFTSITAYADSDIEFGFDADWGNESSWVPFTYDYVSSSGRQRTTLTQEFRLASTDAGRLGAADEIAALVTFICSDAAWYMTGETIHMNGGMYMA